MASITSQMRDGLLNLKPSYKDMASCIQLIDKFAPYLYFSIIHLVQPSSQLRDQIYMEILRKKQLLSKKTTSSIECLVKKECSSTKLFLTKTEPKPQINSLEMTSSDLSGLYSSIIPKNNSTSKKKLNRKRHPKRQKPLRKYPKMRSKKDQDQRSSMT